MAITFLQQKQKQKYLILVLLAVILLTLFVVWRGFLAKKLEPIPSPIILKPPEIKINLQILKDPRIKELQPFEEIKPFGEEIGRENPFIPY